MKSTELVVECRTLLLHSLTYSEGLHTSRLCLRGTALQTQHNQSLNDTMIPTDYCSREPKIIGGNNKIYSLVQLHVI